jgi:pyruvate/2-oxoacid:ferredoxin oxidoreductase beta subunit
MNPVAVKALKACKHGEHFSAAAVCAHTVRSLSYDRDFNALIYQGEIFMLTSYQNSYSLPISQSSEIC